MLEKLRKYVLMIQNFKPYILIAFKRLKIQNPITVHVMADMITALEGGGGGGGTVIFCPKNLVKKFSRGTFPNSFPIANPGHIIALKYQASRSEAKFHSNGYIYISYNCSCASLSLYFCLCRTVRCPFHCLNLLIDNLDKNFGYRPRLEI